jgi:hypothetical protein
MWLSIINLNTSYIVCGMMIEAGVKHVEFDTYSKRKGQETTKLLAEISPTFVRLPKSGQKLQQTTTIPLHLQQPPACS